MSAIDGGNFLSGFAAGAISSIISSGVELFADLQNMFVFLGDKGISDNAIKAIQIATGGLSGGISSSIAGGNFWSGARQGVITSGLNHAVNHISEQIQRPSFKKLLKGYPKYKEYGGGYDDMSTEDIFKMVLGDNYDKSMFTNACATRVSIALNKAGIDVRKDFIIQVGDLKGKGFIASALSLRKWLTSQFGTADEIIKNPKNFNQVSKEIDGRQGIYIMHPKAEAFSNSSISGHATLWVGGAINNAIGNHNHINQAKSIYFWAF